MSVRDVFGMSLRVQYSEAFFGTNASAILGRLALLKLAACLAGPTLKWKNLYKGIQCICVTTNKRDLLRNRYAIKINGNVVDSLTPRKIYSIDCFNEILACGYFYTEALRSHLLRVFDMNELQTCSNLLHTAHSSCKDEMFTKNTYLLNISSVIILEVGELTLDGTQQLKIKPVS